VRVAVAVAIDVTVVVAGVMPQQEQALEYLEALSQALAYKGMLLGRMVCCRRRFCAASTVVVVVEVKARVLRRKLEQSDCRSVKGGCPAFVPVTARAQFYGKKGIEVSGLVSWAAQTWAAYVGRAATAHEAVERGVFEAGFIFAAGSGTLQDAAEDSARCQQGREQSEELHLGSSRQAVGGAEGDGGPGRDAGG